jgi:hypothetical protein
MNEGVKAKLDVLVGMVQGLRTDQPSLKVKESLNARGDRTARMEGRLDEQSRILVALISTQFAAVPRSAASNVSHG